jgi:hypothetical protein
VCDPCRGHILLAVAFIYALRAGIRHLLANTVGRPPNRRQHLSPVAVIFVVVMMWLSVCVKWPALKTKAIVTYSVFSFQILSPCCVRASCVCVCVCMCMCVNFITELCGT